MAVSEVAARPAGAARRGYHPALALTVIAASQLMVVLDATIVNIALPQVQQDLGFSTTDLSWVLNAYTLTFGGLLLLGGRAGDILGRRRVFIAGILVFTLASFLGGLATSSGWLLAARALQGVAGPSAAPTAWPWSPPTSPRARSATAPSGSSAPWPAPAAPSACSPGAC